jgi:tubulin--tyrosine ligase-like protein 12
MTLLAAQLKHPEMHSDYSRAVYGVDIMIDEDNFEPKLLEFTFSPDCIRACKFYPTFYNEILEALFLGKLSENIDKLF